MSLSDSRGPLFCWLSGNEGVTHRRHPFSFLERDPLPVHAQNPQSSKSKLGPPKTKEPRRTNQKAKHAKPTTSLINQKMLTWSSPVRISPCGTKPRNSAPRLSIGQAISLQAGLAVGGTESFDCADASRDLSAADSNGVLF